MFNENNKFEHNKNKILPKAQGTQGIESFNFIKGLKPIKAKDSKYW